MPARPIRGRRPDPSHRPLRRASRTRRLLRAAASAAIWAANGVPLREPLKPTEPALDHDTTSPCGSVIVTIVLLKVACTCAMPSGTERRVRRRRGAAAAGAPAAAGAAPVPPGGVAAAAERLLLWSRLPSVPNTLPSALHPSMRVKIDFRSVRRIAHQGVALSLSTAPASCRRRSCVDLCGCGHSYAFAGRAPAIRADDAGRDNSPNPSAA